MDGWRDGGTDGGMEGWMDGWMDGKMDGKMDEWMDEWMNGGIDEWMNEWITHHRIMVLYIPLVREFYERQRCVSYDGGKLMKTWRERQRTKRWRKCKREIERKSMPRSF